MIIITIIILYACGLDRYIQLRAVVIRLPWHSGIYMYLLMLTADSDCRW